MQNTSQLLMIRPVKFDYNSQTAVNNAFQQAGHAENVQQNALKEFDDFVGLLQENGVNVTVINDLPEPHTPDSIFPNNWISFHTNGTIFLYPMFAPNRRLERRTDIIDAIKEKFTVTQIIDLSHYEQQNIFMEGTGSMVLDREYKIAYACLSPRTDEMILNDFCTHAGYSPVIFNATDQNNHPIYHTNVLMCVGDKYVVICLDAIKDAAQKAMVTESITKSGKKIVEITMEQMNHFAGNMLQVSNHKGEKILVMSSQAFHSLSPEQTARLSSYNMILHSPLTTIETNGGGSARCMMAEIYLSPKS